jgi:hypothetical protein
MSNKKNALHDRAPAGCHFSSKEHGEPYGLVCCWMFLIDPTWKNDRCLLPPAKKTAADASSSPPSITSGSRKRHRTRRNEMGGIEMPKADKHGFVIASANHSHLKERDGTRPSTLLEMFREAPVCDASSSL